MLDLNNIEMSVEFDSKEKLEFPLPTEQHLRDNSPQVNHYEPIEIPPFNFYDLFDMDESNSSQSQAKDRFFSSKNQKVEKESQGDLTIKLKESLGNLKTRRKTVGHSSPFHIMKDIYSIVVPANHQQLIHLFLNSHYFHNFIRTITLLNFIAILLLNYSFRVNDESQSSSSSQSHSSPPGQSESAFPPAHSTPTPAPLIRELGTSNIISLCLQLFCNCVFTLEIMLRVYQDSGSMRDPYVILNTVGTVCCWCTIFFDMVEYDSSSTFRAIMMVRVIRAIIRILEVFPFLRTPFEIFLSTIPSLRKLFFPLVILMLFYATAGIALFSGASKYRCVEHVGEEVVYGTYCGASLYSCAGGQTCEFISEPSERGLDSLQNQFNLVTFDNIGNALLTMYHYIFNTNFSITRGKFTYYINPYVSTLFFVSSSIIFCYIFSNLIMVSMSKAYIEEVESKAHKEEKVEIEAEEEKEPSLPARTLDIVDVVVIVLQMVVTCFTFKGMSEKETQVQSLLDFILLWVSFLIILLKVAMQRGEFLKDPFNVISTLTIGAHIASLLACHSLGEDMIYSVAEFSIICRTVKIVRIIRLLYVSRGVFRYQKFVVSVFLQTLFKIRFFIVLIVCFVFMFKQLGELLFAYEVRFPVSHEGDAHSPLVPYINNFEGFLPSFFSILFLFFNEAWSETMYHYYKAVGIHAVFYFIIVTFIAFLMLMRLYIAVFLCYFKAELSKKAKKELQASPNPNTSRTQPSQQEPSSQKEQQEQHSPQPTWLVLKIQAIYRSAYFDHAINFFILVQSIVILIDHSNDPLRDLSIHQAIENVCFAAYMMEVVLGCISEGLWGKEGFLKKSRSNVISFGIVFVIVAAWMPLGNMVITNFLRRATIVKIFTLFRSCDKEMSIVIDSIFVICKNFFNFVFIYTFFLIIISVIPLKMFYNHAPFHICLFPEVKSDASTFYTQDECTALGGAWTLPEQSFNNIFESVGLMYQLISTESWTTYLQSLWWNNKNLGWQLYFSLAFFVYNICFLNIFLGFIVETYLQLKDKAYNLNLLKKSQIGWLLIRNRIHALFPNSLLTLPPDASPQRKLLFAIISHDSYEAAYNAVAYLNAFLYLITYEDQSGLYHSVLNFLKKLFCAGFVLDCLLKVYALREKVFLRDNSVLELVGSVYICVYWGFYLWSVPSNEERHILEFVLVVLLLVRCKSLLLKYSWCKTNLNAVVDILPKCGNIVKILAILLFFYASIGLEIFKYVKKDNIVDEYNIGFNNIITAVITLLKVSVAESWHSNLSAFIKESSEQHQCFAIYSEEAVRTHGNLGCGTWVAYPYFVSFHVLMVLLVINLLIASMASAYDDNYEIEYNSINIFQLEDCLSLWQKYDPSGSGVVEYKKFWRLTSEIAILFGISKKKLIKRKNKFFEELDLQIYQHASTPLFCYRFHDVITKFSKIKLQIASLDHAHPNPNPNLEISFDIAPELLAQISDYIVPFPHHYYANYRPFGNYKSGETKYIFGLLKKVRQWRRISTKKKRVPAVTKLSSIFDLKAKKLELDPHFQSLDSIA